MYAAPSAPVTSINRAIFAVLWGYWHDFESGSAALLLLAFECLFQNMELLVKFRQLLAFTTNFPHGV